MKLTRREVIQTAAVLGAAAAAGCATTATPTRTAKKKILILGGTGFLGPQLVDAARERGHTLTLFNRGKTRPGLFPDLEKLHGDRDGQLDALKGRSWDAVVDTSGYVPRIVTMSAELLAPNVGQYVFISSISVYSNTALVGMDETAPVAPLTDPKNEDVRANYGALKAASERAAEAAMPGRVTNVRPGLIVGPDDPTDRFTYWPVRIDRGGEALAPGDGSDPVQFIDVRDLARWVIHAIENKSLGVFNAVGPAQPLSMRDLLASCQKASANPATLTWVPAPFLDQQKVTAWGDLPAWVPASDPESKGFATISAARAIAQGLTFRPHAETVRDTLVWWKAQPEERRAKLRAGLTPEREQEVLAAWKAQQPG